MPDTRSFWRRRSRSLCGRCPHTRKTPTLWGAYNAITRFEDFKQPQQEELQDQRLERTWFGGGADIKLKALSKAKELSANWN
jgi:hypothetical protein